MASFRSVLQVEQYEILYSDFILHQYVDSLGRPASRTHGGAFLLEIEPPLKGDGLLTGWMLDPTMELNAQVVLWDGEKKMLKVIKLYNAYCVNLEGKFNATGLGLQRRASLRDTLHISPQAVNINGLFHDNDWPGPSPIVDWDWTTMNQQCNPDTKAKKDKEPSALSEGLHTVLDVVGMIPVVGELADGANTLLYAAEGDYANAALSAAAMIPLAGNVVGAAKIAKRGAKLVDKVRGLKKAQKALNSVGKKVKKAKKSPPSSSKLATQWQGTGDYPGVDKFRDIVVKKGKVVYAGEPGASGFFFTKKALYKAQGSAEKLWQGIQVKKHKDHGYRTKVGIYEATEDIAGAFGKAEANVVHGAGGLQQIFLPDMTKMRRIGEIILK